MRNIFLAVVMLLLFFLLSYEKIYALEKQSGSSASLTSIKAQKEEDERTKRLQVFLNAQKSPLAESSQTLVQAADEYNLDWKFLAAISGLESSFCHRIPKNSYNCWGWGIYGGKVTRFSSYDEGIIIISKNLREKYMGKWGAKNIHQIGKIYAASPTWAVRVIKIMEKIETFEEQKTSSDLSLSL